MKITLDIKALRTRKVMISTPLLTPTAVYFQAMCEIQQLFSSYGIAYEIQLLRNKSDVPLARNEMTDAFLRSDCTDMLQVDNDVGFQADDVLAMLHFDKDVIGANCPRKQIDWNLIREAVLLQPDIAPDKLRLMGATWMSVMSPDCKEIKVEEPLSVDSIAAGFSLIKREAFERIASSRPKFYIDEHRKITDFWSAGPHSERWETEDYAFFRRFREAGGKVWLCPWIQLNHEGLHTYSGDFAAVLQHFSKYKRAYNLMTA